MREIETHGLGRNILSGLRDVSAEYLPQRRLQKMGGGVVAPDCASPVIINFTDGRAADAQRARREGAMVQTDARSGFLHAGHRKDSVPGGDDAGIRHLSAALGIEGRSVGDKCALGTCQQFINRLAVAEQHQDFCVCSALGIAGKDGRGGVGDRERLIFPRLGTRILACGSRGFLRVVQKVLKALLVNGHAVFSEDFLCQIERKAVSVLQFERVGSGQRFAVGRRHHIGQKGQAAVNGFREALLLNGDNLLDIAFLFGKLRIRRFVFSHDRRNQLRKKRLLDTQ